MNGRNHKNLIIGPCSSSLRRALLLLCGLFILGSVVSLVNPKISRRGPDLSVRAPSLVPRFQSGGSENEVREDPDGRSDWFLSQRAYPFASLPADARRLALDQLRASSRERGSLQAAASDRWRAIGPHPTLSAFPSNWGATSGRINAVAVSPVNSQIVLAGVSTGGIWRSTNGGGSFAPVTDDEADIAVGAIAFSRSNPSIVYAGMGDTKLGYLGSGVLKSTDGGSSWRRVNNNSLPSPGTVSKIDVDPQNANRVYVAQYSRLAGDRVASSGFYVSTDGGVSWTRTIGGSPRDFVIDPSSRQTIYLGMIQANETDPPSGPAAGLNRSTDNGTTWTSLLTFSFSPFFRRDVKVAVSPSSPQTIYVFAGGVSGGSLAVSLMASTDRGSTWSNRNTRDLDIGQFGYNSYIVSHPANSNTIYVGTRDLFKSTDGGSSWTNLTRNFTQFGDFLQYSPGISNTHPDQHGIAFSPNNPNILYIANDGGLSRSNDGGNTFHSLNSTLSLTQFTGITIHPVDPALSFGGTQDNGTQRRLSGSGQWFEFINGDGGHSVVNPLGPGTVFTTFVHGAIFRFFDHGQIFDRQIAFNSTFGEPDSGARIAFYAPFRGNGVDSTLYFGTWRLFLSTDTGETWESPAGSTDLTRGNNSRGSDVLTAIGAGPANLDMIYTGSAQGRVMVSRDRGRTWTDVTDNLPERFITSIAVDPFNSETAYLTVSGFRTGHVFKTTDGGSIWTDISNSLPDIPANDLLIDPGNPNRLYLGPDVGIFRSTSSGASWHGFSDGLPPVVVTAFASHPSGIIQAATYGRGAYELSTAVERPVISSVEYDGKKKVTVRGSLFGASPRVLINSIDMSSRVKSASDSSIKIKAKPGVLGLSPGDNSVQVVSADGAASNTFILRL
ncbi:MAG TPA: hypothetical protein VFQ92_20600 [Blastocatellia bacterium]|nr:hypothetical protein [Blastocatellia bacterium]